MAKATDPDRLLNALYLLWLRSVPSPLA